MAGASPDHTTDSNAMPWNQVADKFVAEHGKDRRSNWHRAAKIFRSQIDPSNFEYAERRERGDEPPPDNARWPRVEEELIERDYRMYTAQVWVRKEDGEEVFKSTNYIIGYTGRDVPILEDSPFDQDPGPWDELKTQGGWIEPPNDEVVTEPGDQRVEGHDYEWADPALVDLDKERKSADLPSLQKADSGMETEAPTIERFSTMGAIWEQNEDQKQRLLLRLFLTDEIKDWEEVARRLEMPVTECQERYREACSLPQMTWTEQQDVELLRFRDEYGDEDWIRMSHFLQHTPRECQTRYRELRPRPRNQHLRLARRMGSIKEVAYCRKCEKDHERIRWTPDQPRQTPTSRTSEQPRQTSQTSNDERRERLRLREPDPQHPSNNRVSGEQGPSRKRTGDKNDEQDKGESQQSKRSKGSSASPSATAPPAAIAPPPATAHPQARGKKRKQADSGGDKGDGSCTKKRGKPLKKPRSAAKAPVAAPIRRSARIQTQKDKQEAKNKGE